MTMSLSNILEMPGDWGRLDPIELQTEDFSGKMFVPICLLGIFNPMGPTLVALNMIVEDGKPAGAILCTSLNPFSQSRTLIMKTGTLPHHLNDAIGAAFQSGDETILGSDPSLVLPGEGISEFGNAVEAMLYGLLNHVSLEKPLSEINADYRKHLGDPWDRIPSMSDMLQQAISGKDTEPQRGGISEADFSEWFEIMRDQNHFIAEFSAILEAWKGAIGRVGPGMEHMPMAEAAAELDALGFHYFRSDD